MNNLSFASKDSSKIAMAVESILRKELNYSSEIPYEVTEIGDKTTSLHSIFSEMAAALTTGLPNIIFTITFKIVAPFESTIAIAIASQGIGARGDAIQYIAKISKSISGSAELEAPKRFGTPKFEGDLSTISNLNANGNLLKRVNLLSRNTAEVAGMSLSINRLFRISSKDNAAEITAITLPKMLSMGFSASLDAKEFFDIAAIIEKII
jgi:hypothetical protein